MLSSELLENRIATFVGYGNPSAPYWYIGLEEGGTSDAAFIEHRLGLWNQRGRLIFEDLKDYHINTDLRPFVGHQPKLQPTWKQLARITLAAKNHRLDNEAIREYQGQRLGRHKGETALLELSPLPAARSADWPYAELSDLPDLGDRKTYRRARFHKRIELIQGLVDRLSPEFVVVYGTGFQKYWERLLGGAFQSDGILLQGRRGKTGLILIEHPAAWGASDAYFEQVGRRIGDLRRGGEQAIAAQSA